MHNLFSKNGKKENNGLVFLIRKLADNVQEKKSLLTWQDHQIIWKENAYVWGEMAGESSTQWILIVLISHSSVSSYVAKSVDKKVTDISHCE